MHPETVVSRHFDPELISCTLMPNTVYHSSSPGFVLFKHSQLASKAYPPLPRRASLTERPASLSAEHHRRAGTKGGQRTLRVVVQEKGLLAQALKTSAQPGSVANRQSPQASGSTDHRSPSRALPKEKLVHTTTWLDPRVRAELERQARDLKLSLSEVCAMACRDWVRYDIHRQQTSLFEATQRQLVRQEIQALRDSLVVFELKNACVSEQTRILMTDLYKRHLKQTGMPQEQFYEFLDKSDKMARDNILKRSPKFTELLVQWEAAQAARRTGEETN